MNRERTTTANPRFRSWKHLVVAAVALSNVLINSTTLVGQPLERFIVPTDPQQDQRGYYVHVFDDIESGGTNTNGAKQAEKAADDTMKKTNGDKPEGEADDAAGKKNGANAGNGAGKKSANGTNGGSRTQRRSTARRPRFDPQEVERGRSAFQSSCTQCHDAERALEKKKSRTAWLATVRRMAALDGADVADADIGPIATYLASLNEPAGTAQPATNGDAQTDGDGAAESEDEDSTDTEEAATDAISEELDQASVVGAGLNISGTISTIWRGGNDNLENPDFFPDVWLRADWQPNGPLRGRVTTCTSCHSDQTNSGGFTFELVEATASFDLMHFIKERDCRPEECKTKIEAEIKGGRFVVPFGAFASQSHPGSYRTVTNPLMFNMGRQVNPERSRPPVLPMPYSDEGFDLFVKLPLPCDWNATMDFYAVNGLQGSGPGVDYTRSRSYTDNNNDAGFGGRGTIGNNKIRLGGSVMAGHLEDDGDNPLDYQLAGADATARLLENDVRLYFEYAIRRNDTVFPREQLSYGIVAEVEVLLITEPNISGLVRYDTLEHRDFRGDDSIERFTWGFSTTVFGGSLLMINHERWDFRSGVKDVDVLGLRWVATF